MSRYARASLSIGARIPIGFPTACARLHAGGLQMILSNDGSRHEVYKRRFRGRALAEELGGGEVLHHGDWFVAVRAGRAPGRS